MVYFRSPITAEMILPVALILLGPACGSSEAEPQEAKPEQPAAADLFGGTITTVELEVDYAIGAEPFTGALGGADAWSLVRTNVEQVFAGRDMTLVIPTALSEMEALDGLDAGPYDADELHALSIAHRDHVSEGSKATFHVIWLDGTFEEDGTERPDVLGVSLGEKGVIAMFKPVIEGAAVGPLDAVATYVEQATLIHELGHAVGLVDNGIAMTSEHRDVEHGAHCANTECVMFHRLEGAAAVVDFVRRRVAAGNEVLFGSECLADTAAAP